MGRSLNFHWPEFRTRMTQLRHEFRALPQQHADDFHEKLSEIYVPQLQTDIDVMVPEATGELGRNIKVTLRKLKLGSSLTVSARAYNPIDDYNYAYIQHENHSYSHEKGDAEYISKPFEAMMQDIIAIETMED